LALSAACMWFMFGKTSLASSIIVTIVINIFQVFECHCVIILAILHAKY